ncbi:hypothetical protein AC578_3258 [Pseudocercospora eumusae]|uniref:Mid2 domain-containing protein n=1 Tax=Pseudocercospora eumusae TaxID=321146 RepID=A0A139GZL8_9PEZI|nr:hypothetical protein AC578_3258 [Pseudocercospora eumusae]
MLKLLFFSSQLLAFALAQTCYFPDGSKARESDDLRPCNPSSSGHSACCLKTGLCMSNGLCFQQSGWGNRIARSGCTDATWNDPACASVCARTRRDGALTLYLAQEDEDGLGRFCCGMNFDESTGLCNGTNDAGGTYKPLPVTGAQILLPNSTTPLGDLEEAATTSDDSSETTSSASTQTPATTSSTSACAAGGSSDNSVVAVGAGVGASLGVAFLVASGLFFWQWRKNKHLSSQLSQMQTGTGEHQPYDNGHFAGPPSYGGSPMAPSGPKYAVPNQELPAERPMSELPSR